MWEQLVKAIEENNVIQAQELINKISKEDLSKVDNDNRTLLHLASISGQAAIAKLIINKEPNLIDLIDKEGKTALYHANDKGTNSIVDLIASNETLIRHIMSLMKEGKKVIQAQEIKDNIVMVLGSTGVGKGTLINYLNDIKLTPVYEGGTWKLEAKETLPGISISKSNSKSDTFHPAIYSPEGEEFSYSYVDTPGFGDSRGVAYDVATAYFRQEITKSAKGIKTLLVLPYEDFVSTVSRGDRVNNQMHTLSQFLQFNKNIKHITQLKDSIALVVTQVEPPRFSIDELKSQLAKNCQKFKDDLAAIIPDAQTRSKALDIFINIETKQFNEKLEEFEGTSVSRKGTIKSAFNNQVRSTGIEKDVSNHLTLESNFEIFSRPIVVSSEKSVIVSREKERILELINKTQYLKKADIEIGLSISSDSKLVVTHLSKYANSKILSKVKKAVAAIVKDCKEKISNSNNFTSLKEMFQAKIEDLKNIIESRDRDSFLKYIKNKLSSDEKIEKYIEYLDFFKQLSDTVQYDINKWSSGLENIKNQIENLLKYKVIFKDGTLKISGTLISAEDIFNEIKSFSYITEIKICALNTMFLDKDFEHEILQGANFTMIAPTWKVIGDRIIAINGKDSKGNEFFPKADNGSNVRGQESDGSGKPGESGESGSPGLPGGSGGNFAGIGTVFENLDKLTINTSGGRGGAGQHGGNGSDGTDGRNGNLSKIQNKDITCRTSLTTQTFEEGDKGYVATKVFTMGINERYIEEYEDKGKPGGIGGNAGAGAAGGKGGLPGKPMVKNKHSLEEIKSIQKLGEEGINGKTGEVGQGGYSGKSAYGKYQDEQVFGSFRKGQESDGSHLDQTTDVIGGLTGGGGVAVTTIGTLAATGTRIGLMGAEIGEIATGVTGIVAASTGGIATAAISGILLAASSIAMPVSAEINTKWIELPGFKNDQTQATSGSSKKPLNSLFIKNPSKTTLPDNTSYQNECKEDYINCLTPDFIDPDFVSLVGAGFEFQDNCI